MLATRMAELWCGWMHDSTMWPIHEHYECRTCGRLYRVPWTESGQSPKVRTALRFQHITFERR